MKSNSYRAFVVALSVLFGSVLAASLVAAATTISTNIQTDGTLSVTGTSTLIGNVLIGTSTPSTKSPALYVSDINPFTPIEVHSSYALGLDLYTHAAAGFRAPAINFYRSRGTQSSPTGVSNGDLLGYINFNGVDSSDSYAGAAGIQPQSSVTWTPSDHSSEIIFYTVPAGSTAVSEVFRMGSNADAGDATANISYLDLIVPNTNVLGWSRTNGDASPDTGFSRLIGDKVALGNGTTGDTTGTLILGQAGVGTSTPVANFQVANGSNATTTMELGSSGQNKGSCLKLYRTDGSAIYA